MNVIHLSIWNPSFSKFDNFCLLRDKLMPCSWETKGLVFFFLSWYINAMVAWLLFRKAKVASYCDNPSYGGASSAGKNHGNIDQRLLIS